MSTRLESDWWWYCPFHRRHHHKHKHLFVQVLTGTRNPTTGAITMSLTGSTPLAVPDVPSEIDVTLGDLYDANGQIVTDDTVASVQTITPSDTTLAAIGVINSDGLTGSVETTGEPGTFTIDVTATTASGVSVTGTSEPITVAAPGPAVTVGVNVALAPPAA